MTDRQLALIDKINNYVKDEEDDLYLDFDDYRELDALLQKSIKLKTLAHDLYNTADILCDNISDQPAGCDACWLYDETEHDCEFRELKEKYKEIIG